MDSPMEENSGMMSSGESGEYYSPASGSNSTDSLSCGPYQSYTPESVIIVGLVPPLIVLFGLCANILSAIVFSHRAMRNSSINWYLLVLSLSDMVLLICSLLMFSMPRIGEYSNNFGFVALAYQVSPLCFPMGVLAQTISVYMTTLMSAHRFVGVCFPFKAGEILTKGRVKTAIAVVVFMAILFNATKFFEIHIVGNCWSQTINHTLPAMAPTALRLNDIYTMIFIGWGYTIVMFIIPFSVLIIMNSKVVLAVHRTRKKHEAISGHDVSKRQEMAKEIQTSVMLIGIVVVFLTCNTLSFIVNILELVQFSGSSYTTIVDISNLLVTVNASINIFIYCLFSEKYRILAKYFICCDWRREGDLLLSSLP